MDGNDFCIRTALSQNDVDQLYVDYPNYFSIRLHHGGHFTKFPGRKYLKGSVDYVDLIEGDRFFVIILQDMMYELGYGIEIESGVPIFYHYLTPPGVDLDFGINALGNDSDVLKFLKFIGEYKTMDVYTEHGSTKLHTYFCSPSKVRIEELNDDAKVDVSNTKKSYTRLLLEWDDGLDELDTTMLSEEVVNVERGESSGVKTTQEIIEALNPTTHDGDGRSTQEILNALKTKPVASNDDNTDDQIVADEQTAADDQTFADEQTDEGKDSDSDTESQSGEDSEFVPSEEERMLDVEVDMDDFKWNVDRNVSDEVTVEEEKTEDAREMLDNDEFDSGLDSDGQETSARKRKLRDLRKGSEDHCGFYLGQVFGGKDEVKKLIRAHAVETRRQIKVVKDDKVRLRAVCVGSMPTIEVNEDDGISGTQQRTENAKKKVVKGHDLKGKGKVKNIGGGGKKTNPTNYQCPWTFLCSREKESTSWLVKTLNPMHTCLQTREVRACTSAFISEQLVEQLKENPKIPIRAIKEQFQRKFEVGVSMMKAFRAKSKALEKLHGDFTAQYAMLRDYLDEVMSTNPGTTVRIEVEKATNPDATTRQFKRVYICLGPLKEGFKKIGRDLLGLDGAFMKGPFPGQVLSAVGIDNNNGIYPLSYAIVEAESLNSWTWFLECVADDLDLSSNSKFTFVSDRQKGILPAVQKVFPYADHRYCLRHIHENMKLQFRGKAFKDFLWRLATATTPQKFDRIMEELKAFNSAAALWLSKIPAKHWSRSQFTGGALSDVLLNNICEVFNSKIIDGRDKPIITALEFIREYLMIRVVNVLKVIERNDGLLTPYATKQMEVNKREAAKYTTVWNGGAHYQVSGPYGDQVVVDLQEKKCACRRWEITGLPCRHVICAIWNQATNSQNTQLPEKWVHPIYRMESWREVYSHKVFPINGKSLWKKCQVPTTLTPPKHHKPVGRPKKQRRKAETEKEELVHGTRLTRTNLKMTCQKCFKKGHNQRTCKGHDAS